MDPRLQQALQTVGISNDAQLAEQHIESIWADLESSWNYFPERRISLSKEKLTQLQFFVRKNLEQQGYHINFNESKASKTSVHITDQRRPLATTLPSQIIRKSRPKQKPFSATELLRQRRNESAPDMASNRPQEKNQALRHRKSGQTYFFALFFLLVFLTKIAILAAALTLIYFKPHAYIIYSAMGALAIIFFLDIIIDASARCSVCNMHIYTRRKYSHNRFAHRFMFGLPSLSTVIHIIFKRWFRCPACGTAQILFKPLRSKQQ